MSVVGVVPAGAAPQNSVSAGAVRVDSTFHHIGVYWEITGDDDLDSTMTLEFRPAGTSDWKMAAPAMRAYPSVIVNGSPLGLNSWAASAMFVDPGVPYELRLTLTDPDGGGTTRTATATARTQPVADPTGRQLDVVPGAGGGDGTAANPFRGLQAAADAAVPATCSTLQRARMTDSRSRRAERPPVRSALSGPPPARRSSTVAELTAK